MPGCFYREICSHASGWCRLDSIREQCVWYLQTRLAELQAVTSKASNDDPWIPVNNRLPTKNDADKDGLVLVYREGGSVREMGFGSVHIEYKGRGPMRVTHWTPMLPQPPKEASNGKS